MKAEIRKRKEQNAARVIILNTLVGEDEPPQYRRAKLIAATPLTPPPLHELVVVFKGWVQA